MITKRATLALAVSAGFGIAAAPAQAQETNAAAAVGAIDMSKVTDAAPKGRGDYCRLGDWISPIDHSSVTVELKGPWDD